MVGQTGLHRAFVRPKRNRSRADLNGCSVPENSNVSTKIPESRETFYHNRQRNTVDLTQYVIADRRSVFYTDRDNTMKDRLLTSAMMVFIVAAGSVLAADTMPEATPCQLSPVLTGDGPLDPYSFAPACDKAAMGRRPERRPRRSEP